MNKAYITILLWPGLVWGFEQLPDPTKPFGFDTQPELIIQERNISQEDISWNLTGIRIAKDSRSAILNGRVIREGDRVNGAQVMEIAPAWVIIEHEKQRIRLELLDINIKHKKQAVANNSKPEPK